VAQSDGDLIFCLDSDDILSPEFLRNMTRFWSRKKCDALGMSTSVKFRGKSLNDVAYVTEFEGPGSRVRFESFFEGPGCSLSVVFMMRRAAFDAVGGYPTEHGFDTQGMALRFLCSGMSAYTCPDTVYFHRVEFHESYYLREHARGMLNWNWFCVLEEHLYLFSDEIKAAILANDLFAVPGKAEPPSLRALLERNRNIYAPDYRRMVKLGRHGVARRYARSADKFLQYWLGVDAYSKGRHSAAINHFRNALRAGFDYRIIYYRLLLAALALSGNRTSGSANLRELLLYCQPYPEEKLPLRHKLVLYALRNSFTRRPAQILNARWLRLSRRSDGGRS
jgi:hypothetical protein